MPKKKTATIRLTSGFGEIANVLVKLAPAMRDPRFADVRWRAELCREGVRGSEQFSRLVPGLEVVGFGNHSTADVVHNKVPYDADLADYLAGTDNVLNLTVDAYLEEGRHIRDFLPRLKSDFHYPLNIPAESHASALAATGPDPFVLVYPSSLKRLSMVGDWAKVWTADQWSSLCRYVEEIWQMPCFLLAGRGDEQMVNLINQTIGLPEGRLLAPARLADSLAVCARASYAFVFPAGPGVVTGVLGVPHCMPFRYHAQRLMRGTFTDPHMILDGRAYLPWFTDDPVEVAAEARQRYRHVSRPGAAREVYLCKPLPAEVVPAADIPEGCCEGPAFLEQLREAASGFSIASLGMVLPPPRDVVRPDVHYGVLYALGRVLCPRRVLEIGVGHGHGLMSLLSGVLDAGVAPTRVAAVDVADTAKYVRCVVAHLCARASRPAEIILVRGASQSDDVRGRLAMTSFDYVYVDGSRDGPDVASDLRLAHRLVTAPGAIVVNGASYPAVLAAVREVCRTFNTGVTVLDACHGLVVIRKNQAV